MEFVRSRLDNLFRKNNSNMVSVRIFVDVCAVGGVLSPSCPNVKYTFQRIQYFQAGKFDKFVCLKTKGRYDGAILPLNIYFCR